MKRALTAAVLLSFFLSGPLWAETPADIPDPVLKAAIERALWVLDPTPTDMLGLATFHCVQDWGDERNGVRDLTGLEHAIHLYDLNLRLNSIKDIFVLSNLKNLTRLNLSQNTINDLSPLSGLTRLTHLDLHWNHRISDPSPLSGLANLQTLILRGNRISTFPPLSGMDSLSHLDLQWNQISDISALSNLHSLQSLILEHNAITSLSALSSLSNLRELRASFNLISDLTALADLTGLERLDLRNNRISDISPLTSLQSLRQLDLRNNPLDAQAYDIYLPQIRANNPAISIEHDTDTEWILSISSTAGGSVIHPGEGEFVCGQDVSIRLEAEAAPGFLFAGWSGSLSGTQNPAWIALSSDMQIRATFISMLTEVFVDARASHDFERDGTAAQPFASIQEAIEITADGATVIVLPGVYRENINLLGKNIHLVAVDPATPHGGPCAVIEGIGGGPVIRIPPGDDSQCSLMGFIVTKGRSPLAGAIHCSGSSPTIINCLIVGNCTTDPNEAVVHFQNSSAILTNCTIVDNYSGTQGAGLRLVDSDIVMIDSILWGNGSREIDSIGESTASIRYCNVRGGWLDLGNINANPLFSRHGSWVDLDDPNKMIGPQAPRAVWLGGDYRLKSQAGRWDPAAEVWVLDEQTSPCIDTGSPDSPVGHEPIPNGSRVNLGAYGGTTEASKSLSILSQQGSLTIFLPSLRTARFGQGHVCENFFWRDAIPFYTATYEPHKPRS